jgi:hypothetical protein
MALACTATAADTTFGFFTALAGVLGAALFVFLALSSLLALGGASRGLCACQACKNQDDLLNLGLGHVLVSGL